MSDTLMDFDEAVRRYDPVLGLEVHVELGTATKMFDAAPNVFGAQPNTMVTPTSVGLPGALPVVNARGVEYAIRIGLALGCEIAQSCRFARKNYFYPDLAKDFQTSQSDEPIAYDGALEIELEDGEIHADAISYVNEEDLSQVGIEIHSGRNRIVRRIFEHLGYHVVKLDRVYFAGLTKKNLPRGRWRYLTEQEVNNLRMGSFE